MEKINSIINDIFANHKDKSLKFKVCTIYHTFYPSENKLAPDYLISKCPEDLMNCSLNLLLLTILELPTDPEKVSDATIIAASQILNKEHDIKFDMDTLTYYGKIMILYNEYQRKKTL